MKKYKNPLSIFLVFEKTNPIFYTSEVLKSNHYVCIINHKWLYSINLFLKKDVFFNFSSLIEASSIDTYKYANVIPDLTYKLKLKRLFNYYVYYCYFNKIRLTLCCLSNFNEKQYSIEKIYKNSN